jgi:hypothetical protein
MSINRVDFPTTPNPVGGDWTKINTLMSKAFQNVNVPLQVDSTNIPDGATFQIAGIIYYTNGDTAISGTPSVYVKIEPNVGDSGATADAVFVANLTGVTFNNIYNGYYDTSDNLHIFDEGHEVLQNTKFGQLAASIMPIGFVYTQYPGKDSPIDLGLYGTWTNISSSFAGDFFRAEGGNASAFESGEQADQNKAHVHGYYRLTTNGTDWDEANGDSGGNDSNPNTESEGGNEARPVNKTIRLWERTA